MLFNFLSNFCTPMVGVLEYCSVIYWYCSCQSQAPISDLTYSTEDHCVTYTLSVLASQVSSSFCASEGHCLKKKHPEARFWVNYCTVQTNVILHPVISKGEGGGGGGHYDLWLAFATFYEPRIMAAVDLWSLENPVFSFYVLCSAILLFKNLILAPLTILKRLKYKVCVVLVNTLL